MRSDFKRSLLASAVAIVLALLSMAVWAAPVTPEQASRVAKNWVGHIVLHDGSWGGVSAPVVLAATPVRRGGSTVAYACAVHPKGFVLVPADDVLPAVKAFSTASDFVADGPGFETWVGEELRDILSTLREERAPSARFSPANSRTWTWLDAPEGAPAARRGEASGVVTPLLLTTRWDQGNPYNLLCPQVGGETCPVGCVATASAQVMKYWNHPPNGQGNASYAWRGKTLSANFDHPYDWANMPDELTSSSTEAQKAAVSTLSYELGVAFHMDYDPSGSGAVTMEAASILPRYFRYSQEATIKGYPGNDAAWFLVFQSEVDAGRPALFSIRGTAGGHAVVADGYRTDGINMVHLNMGWSGMYSAYYATNNIVAGGMDFTEIGSQSLVIKIHPPTPPDPGVLTVAKPLTGTAPLGINVTAQGKLGTAPYAYSWDFGDGTPAVPGRDASHIYTSEGTYTVICTLTDALGKTASDSHLTVTASASQGFAACAVASKYIGIIPLEVAFQGAASGGTPPYTYAWDFRDGSTGSGQEVQHTYTGLDTYWVIFTVTDSTGATAQDKRVGITCMSALPPPVIGQVAKLGSPFRLKVSGSEFQQNAQAFIDGVQAPSTVFKSANLVQVKGGTALKAMIPKGQAVSITIKNPDGVVSDPFTFSH